MEFNRNSAPLEEVIEKFIDYRGKTPLKTNKGIPLITAKIIKEGFIQKVNEFIAIEDYETWMKRGIPKKNDVVLTTEAPLGEVAQINTEDKIALAQRVITLRGKEGVLDNTFLKYSLQGPVMQSRLRERESGSTVTGIKSSELKKIIIDYPEFQMQKRIGQTLRNIDEKIELNKNIISNMEEFIHAVFNRWFVDFEFPNENGELYKSSGGELEDSDLGLKPSGWKVIEIGDLALQVSKGTTPTKKDFDSATGAKNIDFLKVKDINDDGLINFNSVEKISKEIHEKKLKRSILLEKDILLSIAGTIGRVSYISTIRNGININQALAFVRLHDIENHFAFIYSYLKTKKFQNEINSKIVQGVQANISLSVIKKSSVIFPNIEVLNQYNEIIIPILEQIENLKEENISMVSIRNILLPKLLSGEVELTVGKEMNKHVSIP